MTFTHPVTMRTPTLPPELAVLGKIDPTLVDREQVEFLLYSVFSLCNGKQDGLYQAVKNLPLVLNNQSWVREYIPEGGKRDSLSGLRGLSVQLARDDMRFIALTRPMRAGVNPLAKMYDEYQLLSCWVVPSEVLNPQKKWVDFLKAVLFVWRTNYPDPTDQTTNLNSKTKLANFCGKLRLLTKKQARDVVWPEFSGDPLTNLSALYECSDSHEELTPLIEGLYDLCQDFGLILKKIQKSKQAEKPPKPSPTPPAPPTGPTPNKTPGGRGGSSGKRIHGERDENDIVAVGIDVLLPPTTITTFTEPPTEGSIDDEPTVEIVIESENDSSDSGLISVDGRFSRLRSARYRSVLDNQFLPWSWAHLNKYELSFLISKLQSPSQDNELPALLCLLSLSCSVNYKEISELQIVRQLDPSSPSLQISISDGLWGGNFPEIALKSTPDETRSALVAAASDWQILPLPDVAIRLLQKLCGEHQGTLGKLLSLDEIEIEDAMRDYCTALRNENPSLRLRPARLRPVIFDRLMLESGDDLESSFAINTDEHAPSVGMFYYSSPKAHLAQKYRSALLDIGLSTPSIAGLSDRMGSRAYWSPESHAAHIAEWFEQLAESANLAAGGYEAIADFHNRFIIYTVWLLVCATGHRPAVVYGFNHATLSHDSAILSDKKSDDAHQTRLVLLSPMVKSQLMRLENHLKGLAQRLRKISPDLAERIGAGAKFPQPNSEQPLFFLLPDAPQKPLNLIGTKAVWAKMNLPPALPGNLSRHWFITGLREVGLRGEWVSAAAGHFQIGQQAWAETHLSAPTIIANEWGEGVDRWLTKLGFRALLGFPVIEKSRIPSTTLTPAAENLNTSDRVVQKRVRAKLDSWITQVLNGRDRELLFTDSGIQEDIRALIKNELASQRKQQTYTLNLLARYIQLFGKQYPGQRIPGVALFDSGEPSPFDKDFLVWKKHGEWLRENIIARIPPEFSELPREKQAAWSLLSLSAYSGLVDLKQLKCLYETLPAGLMHFDGNVWLEWMDGERRVRCWPDVQSTILLTHVVERIQKPVIKINGDKTYLESPQKWQVIRHAMEDILNTRLNFGAQIQPIGGVEKSKLPGMAMRALQSWQQVNLPGMVCAYASGQHKMWAISPENLVRLISGQRVASVSLKAAEKTPSKAYDFPSRTADIKESKKAVRALLCALGNLKSASQKGSDDGVFAKSRADVSKTIDTLVESWSGKNIGSIVFVFSEYARYQIYRREGQGVYRASSTIIDYISSLSPLLEHALFEDWLDLEGEDLEAIYGLAFGGDSQKLRERRAKRLKYFHDFCVKAFGQDSINLRSIDPAFAGSKFTVQPQLITHGEYLTAFDLLKNDPATPQESRELQTLMLVLVFKFGLRVGEVLRLKISDVVAIDDFIVLYVQSNQFGSPKSRVGTRQAPCWTLTDLEKSILNSRIENLQHRFPGADAPIFCQPHNVHQLVSRFDLTTRVLQALKLASGDERARIHDARHTMASAAIAASADLPITRVDFARDWFEQSAEAMRKNWLGITHANRRQLYAISQHLGHSRVSTSLCSYTHIADLMLDAYMRSLPSPSANSSTLGAWCGIKSDHVRTLKSRATSTREYEAKLIASRLAAIDIEEFQPTFLPPATLEAFAQSDQAEEVVTLKLIENVIVNVLELLRQNRADLQRQDEASAGEAEDRIMARVAKIFSCTPERAAEIYRAAANIAHRSRYPMEELESVSRAREFRARDRDSKYEELQQKFTKELKNGEPSPAILDIWQENFSRRISGMQIMNMDELTQFVAFIQRLKPVQITINANVKHADRVKELVGTQLVVRGDKYKSTIYHRDEKCVAPQILVQFFESKKGEDADEVNDSVPHSRNLAMTNFHRLMFFYCVLNEINVRN